MTWVHDRIFAAGGEHLPRTWASFADQTGVTAIVHLRPQEPALFHGPPPKAFLWMNLEDELQAGLKERWLVASFVGECLLDGQRVLLHSSLTRHRVRWVYVAYTIWSGRSVQLALREAAERPWCSPYHTDRDAWQAFGEWVKTQHSKSTLPSYAGVP